MRALITGGAGFVGSHLAEVLLADGHRVHVVDDLSTGSIDNIALLEKHREFHYDVGSVTDVPLMTDLVDGADVIFHLAAVVGVKLAVERPVETLETNLNGTGLLLKLAARENKRVLITSTSEVYGDGPDQPLREDGPVLLYPTVKSRWSYAWSKAIDESLAMAHWTQRGLPVIVARLFNTVGPRQTGRYGMVIPRLVQQALAGEPLTVYGDGGQSRCFAYVGDVARGLADLALCPEAAGQIFNVGNDREVTINDLAARIIRTTGSASRVAHLPYDQVYGEGFEDMRRRVPDLTKIRRAVGYKTTKDLDDIIRMVADHARRG